MKHNNLIIMSALALVISLTGCGNTNKLSEYDMTGISFIEYTDIDTVCEDEELIIGIALSFLFMKTFYLLTLIRLYAKIKMNAIFRRKDHETIYG